jgi:microcystin-dependent protein
MADPFLAEIRLMSFQFAPKGWALCNGQMLPINQNQALFSLLGTTYGGNGQTTFALPDMRGRAAVHKGASFSLGTQLGAEFVTLSESQLPPHTHIAKVSDVLANSSTPANAMVGRKGRLGHDVFGAPDTLTALNSAAGASVGGSQPHENRQPSLTLSYCIALQGIFPSQN